MEKTIVSTIASNKKKKCFTLFDKDEPFLLNLINRYLSVEKKEIGLFSIKVIETLIPLLEGYEDEQKQALLEFDETINKNIKMPIFKKTIFKDSWVCKTNLNQTFTVIFSRHRIRIISSSCKKSCDRLTAS
ncbi:hypothetical protein JN09_001171 [Acholeplasma morum]|uniref:hypothetical protein n=1 Tax=Paracholeplasma morum TaxID=264637 RepID=UPI00195D049E|nr:hypothetical protein [Paracholeplasma morum]MBM7453838.1 hypothetical protein [Paracholeplasma morum]